MTATITHPAKYSRPIIDTIRTHLRTLLPSGPLAPVRILDPFAGVGGIHELAPEYDTTGIELEPEWAACHPRTTVGDATQLPFVNGWFDAVVTSPAYGNRMADSYDGSRDRCPMCDGGVIEVVDPTWDTGFEQMCEHCDGTGLRASKRYTYRIALGRPLTDGNGAAMQWGSAYRDLHRRAWTEAHRVTRTHGLLFLNISDHYRHGALQGVDQWHANTLGRIGFDLEHQIPITTTTRQGNGANRDLRDSCEWLLIFRKAAQ